MGLGPFDLPGTQFLMLYALLLAAAIAFGLIIPRLLRPAGMASPVTDQDELAFLAGGETRLAEAVTARLLAAGTIAIGSGKQISILRHDHATSPAERAVISLQSPASWEQIAQAIKSIGETIGERLARRGLMLSASEADRARLLQTAPYLLLLAFGAIKLVLGMVRDKPIGFLVALLVVTAVCAMIRYGSVDRRTQGGVSALNTAQAGSDRLRRAPADSESGMAVALFGTGVLAGSAFSDFHDLRRTSTSSSSSSDSDSSDSGCSSDSGSSGCGGCGGGD